MQFCKNCGRELPAESNFCSYCGAHIIEKDKTAEIKNELIGIQKSEEENAVVKKRALKLFFAKLKDKLFGSKKRIAISLLVLIVAITGTVVTTKVYATKNYKNNMKSVYNNILTGAEYAERYATFESKVWYNSISKNDSSETDKYTKSAFGVFYKDFNEALSMFSAGERFLYSKVATSVKTVNAEMLKLNNPPKKFENEYAELKKLYVAYSDLTDLVVGDSSYSYETFSAKLESARSEYKTSKFAASTVFA